MELQFNNKFEFNEITEEQIAEPKQYKVVFFNDDFTTKDFVVEVLNTIFHKSKIEAEILMETVHKKGAAVVGIYIYDIAATRIALTEQQAKANGFPLRCEMEEM